MVRVEADFQERRRIVFTARDRAYVNARDSRGDGPLGFSSIELLLVALGNCTLGALLSHESLRHATVTRCRATLEGAMADSPRRLDSVKVLIDLEVAEHDLGASREALERATHACPVGNTLRFSPTVEVELRLAMAGGKAD